MASKLAHDIANVPGVVDSHVFQVPDAPAFSVDVDRTLAQEVGLSQQNAATNLLVSLNNSAQIAPNFWVNPNNSVSYPLVVQEPTYRITSLQDLKDMPLATDTSKAGPVADERRYVWPDQDSHGHVAIEHSPGF